MEFSLVLIVGVAVLVTVTLFSKRLGVAAPLILALVGVGISFLPIMPENFQVPPEVILAVVLPPLLYSSAVNVPLVDFRRNIQAISWLSVVQVILTATAIGFLLHLLMPGVNLAMCIAVGAVVSPTDAVAATSIAKRLGLPGRLVTMLEGESLVNDASALVMLRSATAAAAATAGTVQLGAVAGDFLYAAAVAIVVGAVIGFVTVKIRSHIHDPVLTTVISFTVPFAAYLPAEEVHASGVLSVVVAGLITGHAGLKYFGAQERIAERLNWRTVQFLLENGVFLVMGMELASLLRDVERDPQGSPRAIVIGLIITGALIVARFVFVVPMIWWLRRHERRTLERKDAVDSAIRRREETFDRASADPHRTAKWDRRVQRYSADMKFLNAEGLGWRGGAVIAWSGMRGVVTLAAAQSLPVDTPYRSDLVLIAFVVAIATLLLQGGTLPLLIRWLGVSGPSKEAERREFLAILGDITTVSAAAIQNPELRRPDGHPYSPETVTRAVSLIDKMHAGLQRSPAATGTDTDGEHMSKAAEAQAMQREVLNAQLAALQDIRSSGMYSSERLNSVQRMLDDEDIRLSGFESHI